MEDSHDLHGGSNEKDAAKFALWYHPIYTAGLHPNARFPRDRYELLLARLESSNARPFMDIKTPAPIQKERLLLAHGEDYVERFLTDTLSEKEQKRIGLTPWTPDMIPSHTLLDGRCGGGHRTRGFARRLFRQHGRGDPSCSP